MCGKLICKHEGHNIIQNQNAMIIYANVGGNICVALEYKYDHPDSRMMWVKDGTVCGTNKVCMLLVSNDFLIYTLFLNA